MWMVILSYSQHQCQQQADLGCVPKTINLYQSRGRNIGNNEKLFPDWLTHLIMAHILYIQLPTPIEIQK